MCGDKGRIRRAVPEGPDPDNRKKSGGGGLGREQDGTTLIRTGIVHEQVLPTCAGIPIHGHPMRVSGHAARARGAREANEVMTRQQPLVLGRFLVRSRSSISECPRSVSNGTGGGNVLQRCDVRTSVLMGEHRIPGSVAVILRYHHVPAICARTKLVLCGQGQAYLIGARNWKIVEAVRRTGRTITEIPDGRGGFAIRDGDIRELCSGTIRGHNECRPQ